MLDPKTTLPPQDSLPPEPTVKPTQPANVDNGSEGGLVALLKHMRENEPKSMIIQKEINALTALGTKLIEEETIKKNRVSGKNNRYRERKGYVAKVHAELKQSMQKTPPAKFVLSELEKRYPARPKTREDRGLKAWTQANIKEWMAKLNKGEPL